MTHTLQSLNFLFAIPSTFIRSEVCNRCRQQPVQTTCTTETIGFDEKNRKIHQQQITTTNYYGSPFLILMLAGWGVNRELKTLLVVNRELKTLLVRFVLGIMTHASNKGSQRQPGPAPTWSVLRLGMVVPIEGLPNHSEQNENRVGAKPGWFWKPCWGIRPSIWYQIQEKGPPKPYRWQRFP